MALFTHVSFEDLPIDVVAVRAVTRPKVLFDGDQRPRGHSLTLQRHSPAYPAPRSPSPPAFRRGRAASWDRPERASLTPHPRYQTLPTASRGPCRSLAARPQRHLLWLEPRRKLARPAGTPDPCGRAAPTVPRRGMVRTVLTGAKAREEFVPARRPTTQPLRHTAC